jgi:hypothetical protein
VAEIQPAPELVNPATETSAGEVADPAPADGQQAETPAEATPPQTYHVGEEDYTAEQLSEHIERSGNIVAMQRKSHERNEAANEALEKALAIQNNEELQELKTILTAIKRDGGMNQEWEAIRQGGGPMAMEVRMEQMESKLGAIADENAGMKADDVLGQFAQKHGLTEEQAEAIGAEFLKETKAEQFPDGTMVLDQLDYFHWKNHEQSGQADALTAATKAGYDDAIGRVKAGQAAELGSPAAESVVPWEPPADADERPMLASELAALADDSIIFGEDDGDVLT